MPPKKADSKGGAGSSAGGGGAGTSGAGGKKVTDDEAEPVILEYLVKQNRPYNATDLQANLKAKHNISKPAIVKALASLAAKGEIVEKLYGKQAIYAPKQSVETVDSEELANIRTQVSEIKARIMELTVLSKSVQQDIVALESAPATNDLPMRIEALQADITQQSSHLTALRENPSMMLSTADIKAVDGEFEKVRKVWITRRKAGKEMGQIVLDASGESKEWLVDEMGIEEDTDELLKLLQPQVRPKAVKRKA